MPATRVPSKTVQTLTIRKANPSDPLPWDLLLEADPSRSRISDYLAAGELWLGFVEAELVGVYVLLFHSPTLAEIMNVSVAENHQGCGWGTQLLQHAELQAQAKGAKQLRIATADASLGQQRLYQRMGFLEHHRVPNHFVEHYPEPILEDGIPCIDQVVLQKDL